MLGGRTFRTLTVRTRPLSPGQFVPRTVRPGPGLVGPGQVVPLALRSNYQEGYYSMLLFTEV